MGAFIHPASLDHCGCGDRRRILIAALGATYAIVALKLGNLRAVIVAHFLQDFIAGLVLFSMHLHHARG